MITIRRAEEKGADGCDPKPGILFFINDLAMGGAERTLVSLVNNIRRFRPVIALIQPVTDLVGELRPEIEVVSLNSGRGAGRGRRGAMLLETPALVRNAVALRHIAAVTGCRTISTFLNRSHTIALTAKLAFARELAVVINVHEVLSDHLAIHFAPWERHVMRRFITSTFPRADGVITVASSVTEDLVANFGIPPGRIRVAHNPVDLDRIRRAGEHSPAGLETGGNVIVAVGRLVPLKGFDLLIRALALLPARLDARLLLIGEGPERDALGALAAKLGVSDRVRFLGALTNPWQYMSRGRVLAVPSRTEAFPNVIGEALALSVPVVATRCSGGVAEYLDDGRCGVLVPPDDPDRLAAALETVLTDDELRDRITDAGRRRVAGFDLPTAVARYEDLIGQICGHRDRPSPQSVPVAPLPADEGVTA
jgi:N-acetylgalactosamine-N,N'-diacetylbacillosaminyl-diphospho-undecaprenol 4-alpha-N-acetylgalactosaminyltransferase